MSQEGGLEAPTRHPLPLDDPSFYDEKAFETELRRVADVCHGCRRCFNLCATFPKLFDAIDDSKTGEVDGLTREDFEPAIDACTLCDMCFLVKCPYVPPHPLNVDFPHLMLRARAIAAKKKGVPFVQNQLTQTDRNGCVGCKIPSVANWASKTCNTLTRPLLEKAAGIDKRAELPAFNRRAFSQTPPPYPLNDKAPALGEKVVLYSTCFVNYHNDAIGQAAMAVLAHNGITPEVVYPECCGMPRFEMGLTAEVANKALRISQTLMPFVDKGYTVVSLVPSCTLMIRNEWPLMHPSNPDIARLAQRTLDITAYLVTLAKTKGLPPLTTPLQDGIFLHIPCHSRAQNMGNKAEELLAMLPHTPLTTMAKCSGHGGSWGMMKAHFEDAMHVGRPVMRAIRKNAASIVASECPLAATHLKQGACPESCSGSCMSQASRPKDTSSKTASPNTELTAEKQFVHPIQVMAHAWGLIDLELKEA
ncbi:glycerol-3-phosphate dehydrogenase [bacterium NHP-B]|nr:glycerol-3-phosphate dehydrogenase [bacterium NHP-B]